MCLQGGPEKHVHGHRARALQRRAAKELKKTSKWAARELRSLEAMQRSFIYDAREAIRLERYVNVSSLAPPGAPACAMCHSSCI